MNLLLLVTFLCFSLSLCENRVDLCGSNCVLSNNCACASGNSPIATSETPQLVLLSFEESVNVASYNNYYKKILSGRTNPDGSPITATFYVTHDYTEYSVVNTLYNEGHEIGAHSVTKNTAEYWENADEALITQEYSDNIKIISKFANIPSNDIIGVRNPHLYLSGDNSFQAFVNVGFTYDNTWTVLSRNPTFPFTLEYITNLPIQIGTSPVGSYPGFWELPIINIKGFNDFECNALHGCQITGTAEEIRDWFLGQFNNVYTNSKAPMTFMLSSAWFSLNNTMTAFEMVLNELGSKNDVFFVSAREVMHWAQNPVSFSSYKPNYSTKQQSCTPITCQLKFETQERNMGSCVDCPQVYPWLYNPEGLQ